MSNFSPQEFEPLWESWYVDNLIGKGSFGSVYKLRRSEFGKTYYSALKIISVPQNESEKKQIIYEGMNEGSASNYFYEVVEEVSKEIAIMSELKGNSYIVSYEDHKIVKKKDEVGYYIFIRMELLTSLNDYAQNKELSESEVIKMGIDLCRALVLCHNHNILHRDIKPDNIFVTSDNTFKLGDFGIARKLDLIENGLSIKGTFDYIPPEILQGSTYDTRADIYSLGLVLYHFMNNRRGPFVPTGTEILSYKDKQNALKQRVIVGEQLPSPKFASEMFSDIICKACEYSPERRFQKAEEFLQALLTLQYENGEISQLDMSEVNVDLDKTVCIQANSHYKDDGIMTEKVEISPSTKNENCIEDDDIFDKTSIIEINVNQKDMEHKGAYKMKLIISIATISFFILAFFIKNIIRNRTDDVIVKDSIEVKKEDIEIYELELNHQKLKNFDKVEKITKLTSLSMEDNQLTDITALRNSYYLNTLNLQKNKIQDISSLKNLTELCYLDVSDNIIDDISALKYLSNLSSLHLSNNKIDEIEALNQLVNLTELRLDHNKNLKDIKALRSCKKLQILNLAGTMVTDLSSLYDCKELTLLNLSDTQITEKEIHKLTSKLPACIVMN